MIKSLLDRLVTDKKLIPPLEFVIKVVCVYASWKLFFYAATHYAFMKPFWVALTDFMAGLSIRTAAFILEIFGEPNTFNKRNLIIDGTPGIYVADHCIGLAPMVVFSFLILFFTGSWKNKLWFVPMGNAVILLINALRVAALAYTAAHYSSRFFEINHTVIYVGITYGAILAMVIWWMNRFYLEE